jgi:predicted N-acetyltransferase YhbS
MPDVPIISRPMALDDLATVSQLGIASKQSWGYDTNQMRVFADELTLSPNAFRGLLAAEVACRGGEIVGYYTLRRHADGSAELEHLFVAPERFHQGIGRALFSSAIKQASSRGVATLTIIADPNSAGFYERLGAKKAGDHQSSIPGRVIPIFEVPTGAEGHNRA